MKLEFEQSDGECYTPAAGLYFVGLLALGKTDFDAIDNCRHDDWFKRSMGTE